MREPGFYGELREAFHQRVANEEDHEPLALGKTIVRLRQKTGLSGAELCRRSGVIDPRTLNAIEKGRIQNPSLKSLQGIARGLGCLVRDLFAEAEIDHDRNYYQGTQKGAFQMEFPRLGLKIVSATPPDPRFFCGKMIIGPKRKVEGHLLARPAPLFVEVVMGRLEFLVEDRTAILKEGDNLFFNGNLRHSFRNPLNRESTLWFVTAPSFFRP